MKLKRISFKNNLSGWNVQELNFDRLTLLVGASGVGKTQILRAILTLSKIAHGRSCNGVEWSLTFEQSGHDYTWSGIFESKPSQDHDILKEVDYSILEESLYDGEKLIFKRDSNALYFNDVQTVRLDMSKSAVELLKEEAILRPVRDAFDSIYQLDSEKSGIRISPVISKAQEDAMTVSDIRTKSILTPIEKLFLLKKNDLPEFEDIKESFIEIFPIVEDIDFAIGTLYDKTTFPILTIKEVGVDTVIEQPDISSGMFRTLSHIVTLSLARPGDVILIDEFENGLGVNCINQLADLVMDPDYDIQVVMTSHHPYIINTIPFNCWKVVTRDSCNVRINTAEDLRIGNYSKHDAFMQLIQTKAYQTGKL